MRLTCLFWLACGWTFPMVGSVIHGFAEETPRLPAKRPNILLILCDDLGYADVGFNAAHFGVQTDVVTPHLDQLANEGVMFTQAYVSHPFCGPSRMALLSGRMPHCFGGQKNLPNESLDLLDYNDKGIPETEVLISSVLQQAGYRTGGVGKWHLGCKRPYHPNQRGFDQFYGFLGGGHLYYPSVSDKIEPKVNDYQYLLERNGQSIESPEGAYLTDTLTDEAVEFIASNDADQPFFLYLAYNAPHSPLQGKTEDLKALFPDHEPSNPGNGVDFRDYDKRQNYVAMMYAVDRGVLRLKQTLKDPNQDGDSSDSIAADTLIVFLSDNGGKILQAANNAPLKDDKGSTHEGGIRVPMLIVWPGHLEPGTVFPHPVTALDFYPTFAGLADAAVPVGKVLDGNDVWQDLTSGNNPHAHDTLFWLRHHGGGNEVAIRNGDWKAYRKQFGKWQVHNVVEDAAESNDLASTNREFLKRRVHEGADWSKTLVSPEWHDTAAGRKSWIENGMPKFEQTFQLR
ncbi:N-acetylgalactosamine 6-sulfate sulfatase (GALNS) [Rhodopirellula islandica]|uniref:N-acetylgalactosamine 6-sulfate sulfatase (GALNS) n=1 Tax=Rhodopirellula islandica TaxID=595434 RepID=A0A0J1B543_RHOIS|nr:sulfatase-like hydrolase/transferase [Rhodopirellula islandica]KLU01925.1 N-acetylgalactosamine 6-sulfate sulfatase (GALNS) [Rhodopirellula islandica]